MFGYFSFVVFLSVLGLGESYLTKECADATNNCMTSLTQDLFNGTQFCSAMERYFPCVADELSTAETTGQCDKLTTLYKQATELGTLTDLVTSQSCDISTPPGLELDECSRQMAACSQFAVKASVATVPKTKCSDIEDFIACMATETQACKDYALVDSLVTQEIAHEIYQKDCFDMAPETTTTKDPSGPPGMTGVTKGHLTTQAATATTRTPIPTTKLTAASGGHFTTGFTTTPTTATPSSGSQAAISRDDLNSLRSDLQRALERQTQAIARTIKEQLQALQDNLPSKLLLTGQLTDLLTRTSGLQDSLKAEIRSHGDRLEQVLRDLLDGLTHGVSQGAPASSQTYSEYSVKKTAPSPSSCAERVVEVLAELSPQESWSAEHYVKVARLGARGENSVPQSVTVMFSRQEDRLLAFVKGKDVFQRQRITMEMFPGYVTFMCAA